MYLLGLVFLVIKWDFSKQSCVFDDIKPLYNDLLKKTVIYRDSAKSGRKRSVGSAALQYRPLRIHSYFHRVDEELSEAGEAALRMIVGEVTSRAASIFSVVPVDGPLVLARSDGACSRVHANGPNKEKCASIKNNYMGETCLDHFPIPESHLEGLHVWNSSHPLPVHTERGAGSGISNTDYVLYVRAHSTATCVSAGANIIAYATYCQLDQHNRPIAGYINFCPHLIQNSLSQPRKLATTALHELFHALGFSADLFPKFQDCSIEGEGLECRTRVDVTQYTWSAHRLITPRASSISSHHFSCHPTPAQDRFGPVLHTQEGRVTSHWDAAFMYSSLMTPTVGEPRLTVVDNITLALFEDSGWYQVDYSQAQHFAWGGGGGCQFGLYPHCKDDTSGYFCNSSTVGCHYLHEDLAVCATDDYLHDCSVYKPQSKCTNDGDMNADEMHDHSNHCLLSSLQDPSGAVSGRCFYTSCSTDSQLYIRVDDNWTLCPWGATLLNVSGDSGQVQCPVEGIICQSQPVTTAAPPEATPTTALPVLDTSTVTVSCAASCTLNFMGATSCTLHLVGVFLGVRLCHSFLGLVGWNIMDETHQ